MKQNKQICSICGKASFSSINLPYSNDSKQNKKYLVFSCCNYYKQQFFLSDKEIKLLYRGDYSGYIYNGVNYYKRRLILFLKAFRLRRFIKGKDILEVGSATGDFLNASKGFTPNSITGIELSYHASQIAKKKYGFKFINKDIEKHKIKKKFDTIFMFHVIEHLQNPIKTIQTCQNILKPGGVLIMETPNIDSWEFKFFYKKWISLSVPFHTYLFSSKSFIKILSKVKLKLVQVNHDPVTFTYPDQFYKINMFLTKILYIPLFFIYELIYYISALLRKSGSITVIYMKT